MRRVARGEPDYEELRQAGIWQTLKPARYPDLIVRPANAGEAQAAVRAAAREGLGIAVKGSGHNYTSTYLRDGGMQLDLSGLGAIEIDGDRARVGPGARSADVCAALGAAGRAFPTGHHAGVSLGGFLLGGGMGWNGESWGQFACFNVEALDVVMANGEAETISAANHPDLFWAARGAGPLFCAAVTRFHLRTFPLPTAVRCMRLVYPLEAAPRLSAWLAPHGAACHPDLELILMFMADPGSGQPCSVALPLYHGSDAAAGEDTLQRIAADAPAGGQGTLSPVPLTYADLYAQSLTGDPRRTGADTIWTDEVVRASDILAAHMARVPSPGTVGIVNFRGEGALPDDAACSVLGRGFLQWIGQWSDEAADRDNFAWVEGVAEALMPVTKGCYVNETDILRRPDRLPLCFSESAWRRLQAVRARYDPDSRFPAPPPDLR